VMCYIISHDSKLTSKSFPYLDLPD
jgi:hypothetical protein